MAYYNYVDKDRVITDAFGGLNKGERIGDGEWADMENLTVSAYPVAKVREKRKILPGEITAPAKPAAGFALDDKIYVLDEKGTLSFDGGSAQLGEWGGEEITAIGRNLYTNGGAFFKAGEVHTTYACVKGSALVSLVNAEGESVTIAAAKPASPENGEYWYDGETAGLYRYSASQGEWIAMTESLMKLEFDLSTLETKGDAESLFDGGDRNDGITVDSPEKTGFWSFMDRLIGIFAGDPSKIAGGYIVERAVIDEDEGTATVYLRGIFNEIFRRAVTLIIERRAPLLDHICEHGNRIWGCRYGENDKGEFVNEIYGSAPGDPLNFFRFEGTAADSYTAGIGAGGKWTGAAAAEGYVFFFKEDRIFVLSGSQPSNFTLTEITANGVQDGSEKSIVSINGYVYYKSNHGIMRLSASSYPQCVSEALGEDVWKKGIAGTDGKRYVISMEDAAGVRKIYSYDLDKGMWSKEEGPEGETTAFLSYRNNLLLLTAQENGNFTVDGYERDDERMEAERPENYSENYLEDGSDGLWEFRMRCTYVMLNDEIADKLTYLEAAGNVYPLLDNYTQEEIEAFIQRALQYDTEFLFITPIITKSYDVEPIYLSPEGLGAAAEEEGCISWYAETGVRGLNIPDHKRLRELQIRVKTGENTSFKVYMEYDGDGVWKEIANERGRKKGTFLIRIEPTKRCDTYRLRFEGKGECVIYSITETLENAGGEG